jgi:hypothetical protein
MKGLPKSQVIVHVAGGEHETEIQRQSRKFAAKQLLLVEAVDVDAGVPAYLPPVYIENTGADAVSLTRKHHLADRLVFRELERESFSSVRARSPSFEKEEAYKEARFYQERGAEAELRLKQRFVKQHSPFQLLSPRAFFTTRLFNIRNRKLPREAFVTIELPTGEGAPNGSYHGPELRQSDGLVFLSQVNMLRDVEVGTVVSFSPEAMCRALWSRYDGKCRVQLLEHLFRLQHGSLRFRGVSVQLCLRLEYPKKGFWKVSLDKDIVKLFSYWTEVWMSLPLRLTLRDGLASWLYGYVESQTKLIPTPVEVLLKSSGSDASGRAFVTSLRAALSELAAAHVVDDLWSITNGVLRWMKGRRRPAVSPLLPSHSGTSAVQSDVL